MALGALTLAGPAAASTGPGNVNSVIATIPLAGTAEPEFTVADPGRGVVWSADPYNLYEISEHSNKVIRTITLNSPAVHYPDAMTVDPATGNVILGNTDGTLSIVNGKTGVISVTDGIGTGAITFARGVAVDPANGLIYVTINSLEGVSTPGFSNSLITVVSERTGKVLHKIADPNESDAIAINPRTHLVYVTNSNPGGTFDKGSTIWVMNEANRVVHTISEPSGYPESIAIDPVSEKLFIPNIYNGPLTVISLRTDKVTAEITLDTANIEPYPVAVDPANGTVYVDNYGGTQVYAVSEKTNKVVDTITVPVTYGGISADPTRGLVYQGSDLEADNGSPSSIEVIKVAP